MKIIKQWPIKDNYSLAEVVSFPKDIYKKQVNDHLWEEYPFLMWEQNLTEVDKEKIKDLASLTKDRFVLRVALLRDDELIGFSFGWQETSTSFFMAASLVIPEYRRQGLYTELVKKILEISKEKGFQSLCSFHIATNNPVIIPKLKLGFTIGGLQLDAVHGVMVRLNYHHNSLLQSATRFRAGAMGEAEVKKLLSVSTKAKD